MKNVKILKTTAKHYAEKKLRTFALPPLRRRKLIAQTHVAFVAFKTIQARLYPGINMFATVTDLPPADLDFVRCFIAADWKLVLTKPHDFMVAQKILINSIIKN